MLLVPPQSSNFAVANGCDHPATIGAVQRTNGLVLCCYIHDHNLGKLKKRRLI